MPVPNLRLAKREGSEAGRAMHYKQLFGKIL